MLYLEITLAYRISRLEVSNKKNDIMPLNYLTFQRVARVCIK